VRTIFVEKAGMILKPELSRWCYLRSYSKEVGFVLTSAVGTSARDPGSFHDSRRWLLFPDGTEIPWNMAERTLVVEHHEMGYFAALGFAINPTSQLGENSGLVVILELPTYLAAKVTLLPFINSGTLGAADLLRIVKSDHEKCQNSKATLTTNLGSIKATIEKCTILGEEMLVLDVEQCSNEVVGAN
jgi:hypothetical protein